MLRLYIRILTVSLLQKSRLQPIETVLFAALSLGAFGVYSFWLAPLLSPVLLEQYAVLRTLRGPRVALSVLLSVHLTLSLLLVVPLGAHICSQLQRSPYLGVLLSRLRNRRSLIRVVTTESVVLYLLVINVVFAALTWLPFVPYVSVFDALVVLTFQFSYTAAVLCIALAGSTLWMASRGSQSSIISAWALVCFYYGPSVYCTVRGLADPEWFTVRVAPMLLQGYGQVVLALNVVAVVCGGVVLAMISRFLLIPVLAKAIAKEDFCSYE